jgi:hypothetical protein
MSIYNNLGFKENPFAYTDADKEQLITEYFVPPPYFEAIQGDYNSPTSSIVMAPRGSGKTAQRKMIEEWTKDKPVLSVTIDRFEFGATQSIEDVSLPYHLKSIITNTLLSLIFWTCEYPDTVNNLSKDDKRNLSILAHNYLGQLSGGQAKEIMSSLKSVPQKIKTFWNENIGFLDSVVNFLMKSYDLPEIDLPSLKQEEKKLNESYKYQLELLYQLAQKFGFKAIYILLDKIDETEKTGNDELASYKLIEPLIKDLDTHSIQGYAFKYFLWDKIYPYYLKGGRPDRITQHNLLWSRSALLSMLSKRLSVFSDGKITSFDQLFDEKFKPSADDIIITLSGYSPRNIIRLCDEIIAEQTLINSDVSLLDKRTLDRASLKYSEKICKEIYGENAVRDIKKIDRELFTITHLASNVYKTHNNTVRPKVSHWEKLGFCHNVGNDKGGASKKPTQVYLVSDPRANRLINSKIPIEKWINSNWMTCIHCDADILLDIDKVGDGYEIECWRCNRNLI